MTPLSAVTSLILLTDRQQQLPSLSSDLNKITSWSNTWNMSFNPEQSHTLTISLQKDHTANPPIYFLNNPLKEDKSLKLKGLTISLGQAIFQSWPPKPDAD